MGDILKEIDTLELSITRKDILLKLIHTHSKLFSINAYEKATAKDIEKIKQIYKNLFPHKSEFEK